MLNADTIGNRRDSSEEVPRVVVGLHNRHLQAQATPPRRGKGRSREAGEGARCRRREESSWHPGRRSCVNHVALRRGGLVAGDYQHAKRREAIRGPVELWGAHVPVGKSGYGGGQAGGVGTKLGGECHDKRERERPRERKERETRERKKKDGNGGELAKEGQATAVMRGMPRCAAVGASTLGRPAG